MARKRKFGFRKFAKMVAGAGPDIRKPVERVGKKWHGRLTDYEISVLRKWIKFNRTVMYAKISGARAGNVKEFSFSKEVGKKALIAMPTAVLDVMIDDIRAVIESERPGPKELNVLKAVEEKIWFELEAVRRRP